MFSMHFLLNHRSSERVGLFVDLAQKFIDDLQCASNVDEQVTLPFSIFPLDDQRDGTRLSATPMHLAAAYGKEDVVAILINASDLNKKDQDVTALSLALYCGHRRLARMLLENGARPNCSPNISSLHAAARRGFKEEMELKGSKVDPDIEDKDGATPIVYALQQPEKKAWETICFLFYLGAAKDLVVGDGLWTYAELARGMGKDWLADKLEVSDDTGVDGMRGDRAHLWDRGKASAGTEVLRDEEGVIADHFEKTKPFLIKQEVQDANA